MPSTTYNKRPSLTPSRARYSRHTMRAPSQQGTAGQAPPEDAQVPYRGIRLEDVVIFEVPSESLSEPFFRQVEEAAVAAHVGSWSPGASASSSLSDTNNAQGAQRRMWFIGHVVRFDEDAVELSQVNTRFDSEAVRQQALQSKVNATEMALEEVATRRRQMEDRFLNLERARAAVSRISAAQLHELQSYQHPPAGVRHVLEAVLTILGSPVATIAGWPAIRTAVRDPQFLDKVNSFKADSLSAERRAELRARLEQDPLLLSESSGMLAGSVATRSLRTWVHAQLLYDGLDGNPYHVRGGADVMRLDSRAHALEQDLHVFYRLLHGTSDEGEDLSGPPPRRPTKVELLPAWPELVKPMTRIRVPYSWLVCRLDPPVRTRADVLPSEQQFIEELWGYRVQDPPPSPQEFSLEVSEADEASERDEAGAGAHTSFEPGDGHDEDEVDGLGEPVQVSCGHADASERGSADDGDEESVEALVDQAALQRQKARENSAAAERYAYIASTSSAPES